MPRLREYLLDTAATHNIPYQYFVSKGGTDAGLRTQLITVYQVQSSAFVVVTSIRIKQCLVLRIMKRREMLLQALRGLDKSTVNTIVYGK